MNANFNGGGDFFWFHHISKGKTVDRNGIKGPYSPGSENSPMRMR
jgi:hypothetical protein